MSKVRKDDISHFHVNPKLRLAEPALKTEFPTVSIDKDMEFYIRTLANRDSNVTGETQDASESSFITAEIFRHAKNTVKIYCPTLTDELPNLHDAFIWNFEIS